MEDETKYDTEKLRAVPIVRFFHMKEKGRVQHARCPFHKERTASLAIYSDNGFHCFGCGKHGRGAIDFVMSLGCDFREACEELQKYI